MTPSEFKAWLEGFASAIGDDTPTREQWAAIKEMAATIRAYDPPSPMFAPKPSPAPAPLYPQQWPKVWI